MNVLGRDMYLDSRRSRASSNTMFKQGGTCSGTVATISMHCWELGLKELLKLEKRNHLTGR